MKHQRRNYGQYCGLARTLDVVGDRWSLLVVRELLVRPMRYGDLLASLPRIPTNLLADRLRSLEQDGVLERSFDRSSSAVVYRLTGWGEQLREMVDAAVRWSTPLMVSGPDGDAFRPHWLVVALQALLKGRKSKTPRSIGVEVDSTLLTIGIDQQGPDVSLASQETPATVLRAPAPVVLGLAAGVLTLEQLDARSRIEGDKELVRAILSAA